MLAANSVQPHTPTKTEIDDLRGVVARNLADAALPGLSADNRLGLAYEAALVLSKMAVHATGYRVRSGVPGAHAITLQGSELAIGPSVSKTIAYFDRVRRMRNRLSYDVAGSVSDSEATSALTQATAFQKLVEAWIATNHAALA